MSGEANKRMKRVVCAGIAILALAGGVREARAESHQNYFPLNVGNSWTYTNGTEEFTFTVIGTEEIDGHTYYKFDDYFLVHSSPPGDGYRITVGREVLFRYDLTTDRVLMYRADLDDRIRYDFTGDEWNLAGLGWCRLKQAGVACEVPGGEFSDCINFQFGEVYLGPDVYEPDAYQFGEYLAPNVGNIKYVIPGGDFLDRSEGDEANFELQSYRIVPYCGDPDHPYPVGDLNHDCRVNLLDLAILASHWLERTVPECDLTVSESDITFSNPNPASGEEVTMTVTVHNIGGVDAGEFVVYLAASSSPDGINWTIPAPLEWIAVPHLSAGSSTIIYNRNMSFACCMWGIMVQVDCEDQIDESNEENNWAGKLIEIQP